MAASGVALIVAVGTSCGAGASRATRATRATPTVERDHDPFSGVPSIVAKIEPSIVTITAGGAVGSGVIYSRDGDIVTDAHVVHGADQVRVAFADGRQVTGRVKASDASTDLAVVKVSDQGRLPVPTFSHGGLRVGDLAVVLGSPLGLTKSVSVGIVSGLDRDLPASAQRPAGLLGLFQTDAPISPGNSGGAIVDARGRVIGLAEAYLPPSSGAVAIGFATPSTIVTHTVSQLIASGRARHPVPGARVTSFTGSAGLGIAPNVRGALVADVAPGSPAAGAGLRPRDVVTAVDGRPVRSAGELDAALSRASPGQTVKLTILRAGRAMNLTMRSARRTGSG